MTITNYLGPFCFGRDDSVVLRGRNNCYSVGTVLGMIWYGNIQCAEEEGTCHDANDGDVAPCRPHDRVPDPELTFHTITLTVDFLAT